MPAALTWRRAYLAVTAIILLAPALAMLFTTEVSWGFGDFAAAVALLAGGWLLLEAAAKLTHQGTLQVAARALIVGALLAIWAHLAVGLWW